MPATASAPAPAVLAIAHASQDAAGHWLAPHALDEHLCEVGALAANFAQHFGADWARVAGHWHDLGKYRARFQRYIRHASGFEADAHIQGEAGKAPHSTAGALLATQRLGLAGRVLAYVIAGHHAGLADWFGSLEQRLNDPASQAELNEALAAQPPAWLLEQGPFVAHLRDIPGGAPGFALWVRMLFSCLVDADFLDTERYMAPDQFARRNTWPALTQLSLRFDAHMTALAASAPATPVNTLRSAILQQCRTAATQAPGLFSLTVPTGGGKTLSSMAFALEHTRQHQQRRIIYAIPYTSIIEQTAEIFRAIFGDAVIEHHSNTESAPEQETMASRLACENWDAPLVVTTNVQLFESLFAAKTSRCRKLHNLVGSIIVLDEAQQLPPAFLQPILDVLNLLVAHYGVTVLLCTATQPALNSTTYFDASNTLRGLTNVREIIDDPDALYQALKRVQVELPPDWTTPTPWANVAAQLGAEDCVLAIVNTRKAARELQRLMPEGTLHLSALMCGAHRKDVIAEIKQRLQAKRTRRDLRPLRVVSTQLVEAGVDIDFPVVYRALAGLDSIAQAAGRCNREGRLQGMGRVVVFVPPEPAPPGHLRKGADACIATLHGQAHDPLARGLFARYFTEFYHSVDVDAHGITDLLKVEPRSLAVNFRSAAEKFKLIDDADQASVLVRYAPQRDEIEKWLAILATQGPQRWLMRKLQRYTVSIPQRQADKMLARGDLSLPVPGLYVLADADNLYSNILGLVGDADLYHPSGFVL